MISSAGAVCFGDTTDTAVRAAWAVSVFSAARALTRDQMPDIRSAATAIIVTAKASHCLCVRVLAPASLAEGDLLAIVLTSSA